MIKPVLSIRIDALHRTYAPDEMLRGVCRVHGVAAGEIGALEISVLWHTTGKGDEDMAVHFFQRLAHEDAQPLEPDAPYPFETQLPHAPLSYDGQIVKVRWCVRLRVFLRRGRELVEELPFRLGEVWQPLETVA